MIRISLLFSFLSQVLSLTCSQTKAMYQTNECCATPREHIMNLCKRMTVHDSPTLYTMYVDAEILPTSDGRRTSLHDFPHKEHIVSFMEYRPNECDELCPGRNMEITFGSFSNLLEYLGVLSESEYAHQFYSTHMLKRLTIAAPAGHEEKVMSVHVRKAFSDISKVYSIYGMNRPIMSIDEMMHESFETLCHTTV